MATLRYHTRKNWRSSAASATVEADGVGPIAQVALTPGGWLRGPCWTWHGKDGDWQITAGGDRIYTLLDPTSNSLGQLLRQSFSSEMDLVTPQGALAHVPKRRLLSRQRQIIFADGQVAYIERQSRTLASTFRTTEHWTLELPDGVTGPMRRLAVSAPLALDHRRRRQQASAAA